MQVSHRLPIGQRRRSIALSYANGALWALGNGLASTTLVLYLVRELGVVKIALGVALVRAAPQLVGLLQLGSPALVDRIFDRRRFCIYSYALGALVLAAVPVAAAPGRLVSHRASLWLLIGLWSVYHLLEFFGTVALWSWLADLVPLSIRGSFIGRRNRWLLWGGVAGMLASGKLVAIWKQSYGPSDQWVVYGLSMAIGAVLMLLATLPLSAMAAAATRAAGPLAPTWQALLRPLADRRYLRLVGVGVWLSTFNGLTQSVQFLYPVAVLGLEVLTMHLMTASTELGQSVVSPWLGRLADRVGNRPVMVGCQLLTALGPLFFLAATPASPWWIFGASIVWIAYAGLNIGLTSLMLKLAPRGDRPAYVATYFAVTGLAYAASTIAGGALHEAWTSTRFALGRFSPLGSWRFEELMLLCGWLGRALGAVLLLTLIEPGVRRIWHWKVESPAPET